MTDRLPIQATEDKANEDSVAFVHVDHCRICGAERSELTVTLSGVPDLDTADSAEFSILLCGRCGTAFTDPYPSEETIHLLYQGGTSTDYEYPEAGFLGRIKDILACRHFVALKPLLGNEPKRILDFGTGGGRYADAASRAFPSAKVTGTDFALCPPSSSYYEANSDLTYIDYERLKSSNARFDFIIARHVIEHVHDPKGLLETWLANLLEPGGQIYIEVPNFSSRTAKLLKSRWPLLYVPRHLSHFTRHSLAALVQTVGCTATIRSCELPMMGNVLALKLGRSRYDKRFQLFGVALHPLQLGLEFASAQGTCLFAVVRPMLS